MDTWEPTMGKWNDYESFDVKEPQWKLALKYACERYNTAGVYWHYRNGIERKSIPYSMFVQNVFKILIDEVHLTDYYLLTLGALARVNEKTGCALEKIETMCSSSVMVELREFPRQNTEDLIEYFEGVFNGNYKDTTMYILLSELLFILRQEKCPLTDWEEDVQYYLEIERLIDQYLIKKPNGRICFLCEKIKEQLICNRDESRNRNKR